VEPDALAVIGWYFGPIRRIDFSHIVLSDNRSSEPIFHLLVREKNAHAELWEGARSGTQAAIDVFNADLVSRPTPLLGSTCSPC
jgi:hypothetical protein